MSVTEIQTLIDNNVHQSEDIAFYIESKCKHGVVHNNRIFLVQEPSNKIKIEIQRSQDLCFCILTLQHNISYSGNHIGIISRLSL